jgi:hypothetical protein
MALYPNIILLMVIMWQKYERNNNTAWLKYGSNGNNGRKCGQ